ncbi:MAG TPA: hypothetical protein P5280_11450 [Cyclobacteriaceae bacterium]|nr:hypothetical protein [Cyclobacteriaceae bacterium]
MRLFSWISALMVSATLLTSCFENPDCIGLKNDLVGISFKKLFDGQADTIQLVGLTVSGSDSVFRQTTPSIIVVPLNTFQREQSLGVKLVRGDYSMSLAYQVQTQFESVDCGPRFLFSNLELPQHNFDSVRVTNGTPFSGELVTNIEIFRCPATNRFKVGFRQLYTDDNADGEALEETFNGVSVDNLPYLFYPDAELSSLEMPLNQGSNQSRISFDMASGEFNTLDLSYEFVTSTAVGKCGPQGFIRNLQVINSIGYDIVRVLKDSLSDPPSTNVLLLKCPRTNEIEIDLKESATSVATAFAIDKITAGYTTEEFFVDTEVSKLILPLDVNADQTDFTIAFEGGAKNVSFGYTRTPVTFHGQCAQTIITDLTVLSSEFTTPPVLVKDSIKFPSTVNVEIIND